VVVARKLMTMLAVAVLGSGTALAASGTAHAQDVYLWEMTTFSGGGSIYYMNSPTANGGKEGDDVLMTDAGNYANFVAIDPGSAVIDGVSRRVALQEITSGESAGLCLRADKSSTYVITWACENIPSEQWWYAPSSTACPECLVSVYGSSGTTMDGMLSGPSEDAHVSWSEDINNPGVYGPGSSEWLQASP
jgi:hypothetical protein